MNSNYVNYLVAERKSKNTIENYVRSVESMFKFLGDKADEDITVADLIAYKGSLANFSSGTVAVRLNGIKSYFNYLKMVGVIEEDPSKDIKIPKIQNKVKPYITAEDIRSLLDNCNSARNKAIISLTVTTGMRMEEMSSITMKQYEEMKQYNSREITIVGKGNKERVVYINDMTMNYIEEYLAKEAKKAMYNERVYLIESYAGNHLNRNNLDVMLKGVAKKAGLPYWHDISMHWLRVAFATISNDNHVDIATISSALGHTNIATTSRYIKTNQAKINDAMAMMNI